MRIDRPFYFPGRTGAHSQELIKMADDQPTDGGQDPTEGQAQPNPTPTPDGGQDPQTFDAAYVKQLRDEAAGYRTKLRDAESAAKKHETELKRLAKSQDEAAVKELEEQGKFKELAEKNALKLAEAQKQISDFETVTAELDLYKSKLGEMLKGQRDGLPEPIVELLDSKSPIEQLEWLSKYKAQLAGQPQQPGRQTPQQQAAALSTFNPQGGDGAALSDEQRVARLNQKAGFGQSVFG
jgi:hypothetical protein